MATFGKIIAMFHQIITFAQKHQNLSKPIFPTFQTKVRPRSHRQLGKQPHAASSASGKVIIPSLEKYPEAARTKCSPTSNIGHPQNRVRNKVAVPAPLDASLLWIQCQVLARGPGYRISGTIFSPIHWPIPPRTCCGPVS